MFEWWWEFLYNISEWINKCIDGLYKLFLFLAGVAPADVNQEIAGNEDANILVNIFTDNNISVMFLGFLGFAALVFTISIIIGLVRSEWSSKDNGEGKLKVLKQSLKGFLLVFLIPTIFSVSILATSILLSSIVSGMSGTSASEFSLAQKLFEICLPENSSAPGMPNWTDGYSQLTDWGWNLHSYNYLIAYLGGIIILFIIGLAALNLVERIIDLVFLYLVSPFVIAVSPLDEGNRLGIWKDLVISKLLSVAGMVVCFYIYFLCLPIVDKIFASDTFIVRLGYLIFAIGGALAARKGGLLISNLVGHNTALIEGQQAGQTAQIVGTGFRAGLGIITGLAGGALHLLGRGDGAATGDIANAAGGAANTVAAGGAAAAGAAASVSNILHNNGNSTFSGIQAAGGIPQQNSGAFDVDGFYEPAASPKTTPISAPGTVEASPTTIINGSQGFTDAAPTAGNTVVEQQPAFNPKRVEMPADNDIKQAMNGAGFNGGEEGEGK